MATQDIKYAAEELLFNTILKEYQRLTDLYSTNQIKHMEYARSIDELFASHHVSKKNFIDACKIKMANRNAPISLKSSPSPAKKKNSYI